MILKPNKTGKFVITDRETYIKLGSEHTSKDHEVDRQQIKATQRVINGHMSMLGKAFNQDKSWGHEE